MNANLERLKDITYKIKSKEIIKETYLDPSKKMSIERNLVSGYLSSLTVKGLN